MDMSCRHEGLAPSDRMSSLSAPAFASTRGLSKEEQRSLAGTYLDMGIGFYQGACRNDAKALAFFREADRLGHMKAGRWIGFFYANGKGVPRDFKKAASWYKKSADKGDITATWLLGELYEKEKAFPKAMKKPLPSTSGPQSAPTSSAPLP